MSKIFLVCVLAFTLIIPLDRVRAQSATATLALSPSSGQFPLEQTFTVDVILNTGGQPIAGVDLNALRFEPTILQVVDGDTNASGLQIKPGALMPSTLLNSVDNTAGTIKFSQVVTPGTTYQGTGILATVSFKVIAEDTAAVTFDFVAGKTNDTNVASNGGLDILASVINGSYTAGSGAPSAGTGILRGRVSRNGLNQDYLSGVLVRLDFEDRTVTTDAQGQYELTGLPFRAYRILVSKIGYVSYLSPSFTLTSANTPMEYNLYVQESGTGNTGTASVFGKISIGGFNANYLSGARVRLNEANRDVLTAPDGRYDLVGVAPGQYSITISKDGYHAYTMSGITLSAGGQREVNLYLRIVSATGDVCDRTDIPYRQDIRSMRLYQQLKGRIVLTVEENGEAYYIHPKEQAVYYLCRPADAFRIMREKGVGIVSDDLMRIPLSLSLIVNDLDTDGDGLPDLFETGIETNKFAQDTDGDGADDRVEVEDGDDPVRPNARSTWNAAFAKQHAGTIFLDVHRNGEAWYVYPVDGKRYYFGRPHHALVLMKELGLGISNVDFDTLLRG